MNTSSVFQHVFGKLTGSKVIAFDMDDTLITGAYTNLYPYMGAKDKIESLYKEGYNIIVISNQKSPQIKTHMIQAKVNFVCKYYNVPMHFFCAQQEDKYRKPEIGILSLIPSSYGTLERYIGDAADREGDHSDCDLMFAKNAKLDFTTPEEYFNTYPVIERDSIPSSLQVRSIRFLTLVLLVGFPASGKSLYMKTMLTDYFCISRDELKTMPKCISICKSKLQSDVSVVIDNLNATIEDRKKFIDIAKEQGADVVVIHFRTTMRAAQEWNKKRTAKVPDVVYYTYRKKFDYPTMNEGIDEIYSIM